MEGGNRKRERQRKETKDKNTEVNCESVARQMAETVLFKKSSSGLFLWSICGVLLRFLNKLIAVGGSELAGDVSTPEISFRL